MICKGRGIHILFYHTSPLDACPLLAAAPLPSGLPGVATQLMILRIRFLVAICFEVSDLMNLAHGQHRRILPKVEPHISPDEEQNRENRSVCTSLCLVWSVRGTGQLSNKLVDVISPGALVTSLFH